MSKRAQTRSTEIAPGSFNEDSWQVRFDYSTGARVDRGIYLEDLVVSDDAIDTSRLDAGAVHLIRDHMPYGDPVGRVISHGVENGKAFAIVQLSRGEANASTVEDIKSGVIRFCSVGYVPLETEVDDTGDRTIVTVTRWMPLEISLTPIPADIGAQTRSLPTTTKTVEQKGKPMKNKQKNRATPEELESQIEDLEVEQEEAEAEGDTAAVEEIDAEIDAVEAELEEAEAETEGDDEADDEVATERARSANIFSMATRNNLPAAVAIRAIERGTSEKAFRAMIKQRKISNSPAPLAGARTSIQVDETEKRSVAATNAVYGLLSGKRSQDAGDFAGLGMAEIARASLGRSAVRMGNREVISAVLKRTGMHTSSDFSFSSAAGGAIERRVREIFENLEMPLQPLVRSTLVNDFRAVDTYSIGGFPELKETPEGGEYEAGSVLTEAGSFSVKKYGRILRLSFEAMVNDDLRLLDTAIRGVASRGVKLRNKLIRASFDAKLADGRSLFHSTRGNVINVALDVEGLSAARSVMRKMKGIDGDAMGLSMKYLIVGPDLETKAQQLLSPITAAVTGQVNPFSGTLEMIVDPLMEGNEWIISASPDYGDAIELADLRGYEGVQVEEVMDPVNDGFSWRARTFAGAHPTGWRGFVKSTGGN